MGYSKLNLSIDVIKYICFLRFYPYNIIPFLLNTLNKFYVFWGLKVLTQISTTHKEKSWELSVYLTKF